MKIGIDAAVWQNNRGYGRHARALLNALVDTDGENRYIFVTDFPATEYPYPSSVEIRSVDVGIPASAAASASGHRSIGDMWRMSRALSSPDFDILVFPSIYSYVPVATRAKKLVMIHDIIPEKFPEHTLPSRTARMFWSAKSYIGRWQADAIVTVSDYSRKCISEQFNIPTEKIYVVGEASDPVFRLVEDPVLPSELIARGIAETSKMVVYVGGFGPHKNLDLLLQVFSRIVRKLESEDLYLVMVGEYEREVFYSEYARLRQLIDVLDLTNRVIFTGYLPDEQLVDLLNLASLLVLPSLMEGFGLPAIEAAACGCPVVATKESPLPEIMGEGGLYIDPTESDQLEEALSSIILSPRLQQSLRRAALVASNALTWDSAAEQMLAVFHSIHN